MLDTCIFQGYYNFSIDTSAFSSLRAKRDIEAGPPWWRGNSADGDQQCSPPPLPLLEIVEHREMQEVHSLDAPRRFHNLNWSRLSPTWSLVSAV